MQDFFLCQKQITIEFESKPPIKQSFSKEIIKISSFFSGLIQVKMTINLRKQVHFVVILWATFRIFSELWPIGNASAQRLQMAKNPP